eukprot:scpid76527/ scgid8003/ 
MLILIWCCVVSASTQVMRVSCEENGDSKMLDSILQLGSIPAVKNAALPDTASADHLGNGGAESFAASTANVDGSKVCRTLEGGAASQQSSVLPCTHDVAGHYTTPVLQHVSSISSWTENKTVAQLWPTQFLASTDDVVAAHGMQQQQQRQQQCLQDSQSLLQYHAQLARQLEEFLYDSVIPDSCVYEDESQPCLCETCDWYCVGGWQTSLTAHMQHDSSVSSVLEAIGEVARQLLLSLSGSEAMAASATVLPVNPLLNVDVFGASHRPHRSYNASLQHSHASLQASAHTLSAIFCVAIGDGSIDSNFVRFSDPRPQASPMELVGWLQGSSVMEFEMKAGKVVVFPAYLRYHLLPNGDTSAARVFITVDILTSPLPAALPAPVSAPLSGVDSAQPDDALLTTACLQVNKHWTTPIYQVADRELLTRMDDLTAFILDLEATELSVQKSNKGGWQSRANFFQRNSPVIALLRQHTYTVIVQYLEELEEYDVIDESSSGKCFVAIDIEYSWANVNRLGDSNAPHTHPSSTVSGVYYVSNGGDATSQLHFIDPRATAGADDDQSVHSRNATAGTFVIFPSWLEHYVDPHRGSGKRMSVSFNALVRRISQPPPLSAHSHADSHGQGHASDPAAHHVPSHGNTPHCYYYAAAAAATAA